MKKIMSFLSMLSIILGFTIMGLNALETPQTPDVNLDTLRIEQTVAKLQEDQIKGQKLLGKSSSKLEALSTELKAKIAQLEKSIKEKTSPAQLEKLKQGLRDLREKISTELNKLK